MCHDAGVTEVTHTHTTLTLHLSQVARFGIAAAPKSRYPHHRPLPVALLSAAVTQLSVWQLAWRVEVEKLNSVGVWCVESAVCTVHSNSQHHTDREYSKR